MHDDARPRSFPPAPCSRACAPATSGPFCFCLFRSLTHYRCPVRSPRPCRGFCPFFGPSLSPPSPGSGARRSELAAHWVPHPFLSCLSAWCRSFVRACLRFHRPCSLAVVRSVLTGCLRSPCTGSGPLRHPPPFLCGCACGIAPVCVLDFPGLAPRFAGGRLGILRVELSFRPSLFRTPGAAFLGPSSSNLSCCFVGFFDRSPFPAGPLPSLTGPASGTRCSRLPGPGLPRVYRSSVPGALSCRCSFSPSLIVRATTPLSSVFAASCHSQWPLSLPSLGRPRPRFFSSVLTSPLPSCPRAGGFLFCSSRSFLHPPIPPLPCFPFVTFCFLPPSDGFAFFSSSFLLRVVLTPLISGFVSHHPCSGFGSCLCLHGSVQLFASPVIASFVPPWAGLGVLAQPLLWLLPFALCSSRLWCPPLSGTLLGCSCGRTAACLRAGDCSVLGLCHCCRSSPPLRHPHSSPLRHCSLSTCCLTPAGPLPLRLASALTASGHACSFCFDSPHSIVNRRSCASPSPPLPVSDSRFFPVSQARPVLFGLWAPVPGGPVTFFSPF